jgi:AcrR family transcriptional regulator
MGDAIRQGGMEGATRSRLHARSTTANRTHRALLSTLDQERTNAPFSNPGVRLLSRANVPFILPTMPRVSQEHLEARRQQILDAARRCFIRKGFHGTSMQDVLREADLSAGAVYRYFRSKEEIIVTIATDAVAELGAAVEGAFDAEVPPPLEDVLDGFFATLERLDATQDLTKLAIQVWEEALHSPLVAERFGEATGGLLASFTHLMETYQARGLLTPDVPAQQVAMAVASFLAGFIVRRAIHRDVDAAMFGKGVRALLAISPPQQTDSSRG